MTMIAGEWAGNITGTNNANVYVEFNQTGNTIEGYARINDPIYGVAVYNISGTSINDSLQAQLKPDNSFFEKSKYQTLIIHGQTVTVELDPASGHGVVTVMAKIHNEQNHIEGSWQSTIGTGGKLFLDKIAPSNTKSKSNKSHSKKNTRKVFISYCHKDAEHLDRLHIHLKPLEKQGIIETWDDTKIKVGDQWQDKISEALKSAGVAILIISADFLASDFIVDNELPPILENAQTNGTRIVPIILKPCRFSRDKHLSKFQALNPPENPVQGMTEIKQEELWDRLAQIIETELS